MSREELAERYGAEQADLDRVAAFAQTHGLSVVESSKARRTVRVQGTVEQMSRAFAVDLGYYESDGERYRGREGPVHVPSELQGIVEGVFGLDNRRMAHPMFVLAGAAARAGDPSIGPLTPPQVATLYDFPAGSAAGQTIGVLEFAGGYDPADIEAYFSGMHLTTPALTWVGVDGRQNSPGSDLEDDMEVALDIDVAGSVAHGAKVVAYFAPASEQGWVDVITTAVYDTVNRPSVLSISWGATDDAWSAQAMDAISQTFQEAAAAGVTVLASSGDDGSGCGVGDGKAHVNYPASDPYIISCGGTTIENVAGTAFTEITWTGTGGGVSAHWPLPGFQSEAGVPASVNDGHVGRGVPDIAGNADADSGYGIVVRGSSIVVGGTSAVAPLYAGLIARVNALSGEMAGYLNADLYDLPELQRGVFRDLNDGRSNASGGALGYTAGPGWDACTGWGSVNGTALVGALRLMPGLLWHTVRESNGAWSGLRSVNGQFAIPGPVSAVAAAWDGKVGETQLMFATYDGLLWHTLREPGGAWSGLGSVNGQFTIPHPVSAVAGTWDGKVGETQFMFATSDGRLWHTIRQPGGAWSGLDSVNGHFAIPGPVTAVAAAWDAKEGETQFMFATSDGRLWHTIRQPSGTWSGLGSVNGQFQIPAPVRAVSATNDGNRGETQFMFTTDDGRLWHTIHKPNGAWSGLDSVNGHFAIPHPVTAVAAAWDGKVDETQFMFATDDGRLWHSIREASGAWTGLGNVQRQFQIPAPVQAVSATNDGNPGETQFMFST